MNESRLDDHIRPATHQINFMATSICPFCGAGIDTTPDDADTARWYRKHHPDLAVGSIIPEPCHDCGKPYEIGDKVRRRQNSDEQLFLVKALLERPNQPPLIEIVAEDGSSTFTIVAQLEHIERTGYIVTPDTVLRRDYF